MKRNVLFSFTMLVVLGLACSSTAPSPTPTATFTPEPPTFTPSPTSTSTLTPTATPNLAATAAFNATQEAGDVLTELDGFLADTDIPYKDGHLAWKQDDKEVIRMQGPDGIFSPFAEDFDGGNFILKSDVTWNATGIIICGIIFRSEADQRLGAQYQFLFLRFSGAPAWAIEYHEFGEFRNSPTGVKYSSAVDLKNDATNQVVIVAQNEVFTVFINGVRQGRYFDNSKQREDGVLAFLGMQDSGNGSCTYANTTIWELK